MDESLESQIKAQRKEIEDLSLDIENNGDALKAQKLEKVKQDAAYAASRMTDVDMDNQIQHLRGREAAGETLNDEDKIFLNELVSFKFDKESAEKVLENNLNNTRKNYLDNLATFNKQKSALKNVYSGLNKIFGSDKKDIYDDPKKHPNKSDIENLNNEYGIARVQFVEKQIEKKQAELEASGKTPDEIEGEMVMVRQRAFAHIRDQEQQLILEDRQDRLSEKKKGALGKFWDSTKEVASEVYNSKVVQGTIDLYKKSGDWGPNISLLKNKDGSRKVYKAGRVVRSAALGALGGYGLAYTGLRVLRGVTIAGATSLAVSQNTARRDGKIEKIEEERENVSNKFNNGEINVAEYEKRLDLIDKEEQKVARKAKMINAAVLILAVGSSYAAGAHDRHVGHSVLGGAKAENKGFFTSAVVAEQKSIPIPHAEAVASAKAQALDSFNAPNHAPVPDTHHEAVFSVKAPAPTKIEIPKGAVIGEHNVSITHAFKMQLEADKDLAHKLGYDVAENKPLFLKHLGEKLGYINEKGEGVGVKAGMGEAYVLSANPDSVGDFAPSVDEYQNGALVEHHDSGATFEGDQKEKYEYLMGKEKNIPRVHQDIHHETAHHLTHRDETLDSDPQIDVLPEKDITLDVGETAAKMAAERAIDGEYKHILTKITGHRTSLFGPKHLDSYTMGLYENNVKNATIGEILSGKVGNNHAEVLKAVRHAKHFINHSHIDHKNLNETFDSFVKRSATIRTGVSLNETVHRPNMGPWDEADKVSAPNPDAGYRQFFDESDVVTGLNLSEKAEKMILLEKVFPSNSILNIEPVNYKEYLALKDLTVDQVMHYYSTEGLPKASHHSVLELKRIIGHSFANHGQGSLDGKEKIRDLLNRVVKENIADRLKQEENV